MSKSLPFSGAGLVRGGVAAFLFVTCLSVWIGPIRLVEPAQAQIPDAGLQRKLVLEQARRTNQLLVEIKQILKTGTFNVRMEGADNKSDVLAPNRTPGK